jgi:hypothetical protein
MKHGEKSFFEVRHKLNDFDRRGSDATGAALATLIILSQGSRDLKRKDILKSSHSPKRPSYMI